MATAALQVAGTAAFGPVGGFIGAAVGSYLDQAFIMPFLFPQDPIQGPRVGELQLQSQDEGAPMNATYGANSRVAGVIIWISELKERKETEEVGGKGGGGQEIENFFYSVDVAIAFADAPSAYEAIDRIYGDVGLLYDNTPNVDIDSTIIAAAVNSHYESIWNTPNGQYEQVLTRRTLKLTSSGVATDLGELRSGRNATIAGFTETDYNGTFRCKMSRRNDDGTSIAKFEVDITTDDTGEAEGNTIMVDQTNPKFDSADMDGIEIHLGGPAQAKSTFLSGVLGATNVPAFRDQMYVVLENLQLERFGNRVPQFQGVLQRGTSDEVDDVFSDVLTDSDMDPSEYDVSGLSGVACKGYATRGPQPVLGRLQPLMMNYNVLGRETNGVITFFYRDNIQSKAIDPDDLAAHSEGSRDVSVPHFLDDDDDLNPPTEVLVKYIDEENQLQPGEQAERNPVSRGKYEKRTVDVSITMDGGEGRDLAAKMLWMGTTSARTAELQLPPSYVDVQENDLLTYSYLGEPHQYIVDEKNEGGDGTAQLMVKRELTANVSHSSPHDVPDNPNSELTSPYDCDVTLMDCAPLKSAHVDTPVLYVGAVSNALDASWRGATLFHSLDGGDTFASIHSMNTQASVGSTDTELGAGTGCAQWDRGSQLDVTMLVGTLSSVSDIECLNGSNRAMVGNEIIGFTTAVLASGQPDDGVKYELTGLLRGLAGSEQHMDDHNVGDRFVHLNAVGVEVVPMSTSAIDQAREYVAVSPGGDPLDYFAATNVYQALSIRDFFVVHIQDERNVPATNDWTVKWQRRSRAPFRVLSQVCSLLEPTEDYEVDVYNGAGDTVLRTITSAAGDSQVTIVSDNPQVVYDEADQITDHGSAQATIRLKIYQVNAILGRSRGTDLLVIS